MTSRYSRIRDRLQAAFNPLALEILDESAKHAGHAHRNNLPDGETHYHVTMVSDAFTGQTRLKRSRAVHEALDAEFKSGLHALSLNLSAPSEKSPS
jgi:stress-induced morphogen